MSPYAMTRMDALRSLRREGYAVVTKDAVERHRDALADRDRLVQGIEALRDRFPKRDKGGAVATGWLRYQLDALLLPSPSGDATKPEATA